MTFDSFIEWANALGMLWVTWMQANLLDSAVILLIVSIIWSAVRHHVAPQVGYLLFLLVPLKLLVPGSIPVQTVIAQWSPSVLVSVWLEHRNANLGEHPRTLQPSSRLKTMSDGSFSTSSAHVIAAEEGGANRPLSALPSTATASLAATAPNAGQSSLQDSFALMPSSTLNVSALLMLVWIPSVFALLGRFLVAQRRLSQLLLRLGGVGGEVFASELHELCQRIGIRERVRIIFSDEVTTAAVTGIRRPTVVMPLNARTTLTRAQLEWVLLHELAHVYRRDLWVIALQRLVNMLHFFNPALWIANRMIHRLREFACDDLAVVLGHGTSVDSSEAFLLMLRHSRHPSRLTGSLGIFGLASREACFERVRRLLDTDRVIRREVGRVSLCAFVLLALLVLPNFSAVNLAQEPPAKSSVLPDDALAKDVGEFTLLLIGPDKRPLPAFSILFDAVPLPGPEEIREGQFLKKGKNYGVHIATNSEGQIVLKIPPQTVHLRLIIETAGYEPYSTIWTSENPSQQLPAKFTIELGSAWTVGGVVVDSGGQPIPNVEISPSLKFKRRTSDASELHLGTTIKTDQMGKWQFANVPESLAQIAVSLNHPDYAPLHQVLTRKEFERPKGQLPAPTIRLESGLTVTGRITDEEGQPIGGARVFSKFSNDMRDATTDRDGMYVLKGCPPLVAKIVVAAKGYARDMQSRRIGPDTDPIDFVMKPGGKVRVRVLDKNGNPAPKSRIFFQRWRGDFFGYFEFDGVNQFTDQNGVWEWNEAPLDEFEADICPPTGMQLPRQVLKAREEEYVFRPPARLEISGEVVDAETRQPVRQFDVIPGSIYEDGRPFWNHKGRFTVRSGFYTMHPEQGRAGYLFRIEASGYRTDVSRVIQPNEGSTNINIALRRAADLVAVVKSPNGSPAGAAKVAIGIAGTQIDLHNGDFRDRQTYCAIQTTNDKGELHIVAQDQAFDLIILHESGFAQLRVTPDFVLPDPIPLQAWARVEGQFRIGGQAAANTPLVIEGVGLESDREKGPSIINGCRAVTDGDGRFSFDRVFPGHGSIGREIIMLVEQGATTFTSSGRIPFDFEAGTTSQIQLGGTGRPVVGRLYDPNDPKKDWKQVLVDIRPQLRELPNLVFPNFPPGIEKDPVQWRKWMQEWQQTDEGKAWTALQAAHEANKNLRNSRPYYQATLSPTGEFRFDDIPEGDYVLQQLFSQSGEKFSVAAMPDGRSNEPLDLGTLILGKQ